MSCPYYDQYEEKCIVAPRVEPRLIYLKPEYAESFCMLDYDSYRMCSGYRKAKDADL